MVNDFKGLRWLNDERWTHVGHIVKSMKWEVGITLFVVLLRCKCLWAYATKQLGGCLYMI